MTRWFQKLRPLAPNLLLNGRSKTFHFALYPCQERFNDPDDNPPIGIILCTDKDSITAEYALGGLSNNIFASRYVLYMPNKEQLIRQVKAVLEKWHEGDKD